MMTPSVLRRLSLGLVLALVVIAIDQWSKFGIQQAFHWPDGVDENRLYVLPVLDFVLTWNRGVSYSLGATLGSSGPLVFIVLSSVIVVALVAWMMKSRGNWVLFALGMVVGGALSNLVDRIRFGAVEDFLYLHIGSFACFGVFNLADSAISVGAVVLVFESLFTKPTSLKNTP